ncbi:SPFH domain-containing protein [Labrys monachus]|uniref:Membrane protease subunit HflC n=1 Tax=Labrys monachus TaxID=217067 RepID=A0ABU0FL25_9HYPH|nr:SPFH domain-containing protein [Labrys monachus]MDQ0395226.1 membrane protease subunit HflC [Labrys monachus]
MNVLLEKLKSNIVLLVGLVVLVYLGLSSYFTVNQNEVGAVLRFGRLVSDEPVQPGLHFKLPAVDSVHTIRTSIEKIPIPEIHVKTIDNQFVSIDMSLTYHFSDPLRALFQVGDMGGGTVSEKVIPFVQSRTLDVFGQVNALEIADKKKGLENSILTAIQAQAAEMFGVKVEDIQITQIKYDENFERNIQITVQTRNQQLAAVNILKVKQTEAEQAVAVAKGEADAAAASADGQKRVAIAEAEARAQSVRLAADAAAYDVAKRAEAEATAKKEVGAAEAEVISIKAKAAGSSQAYADILRAESAKNWRGEVPNVQLGGAGGQGATPVVVLPPEALKPAQAQ